MDKNEEFEKWTRENSITDFEMPAARRVWNARQPEIDALKTLVKEATDQMMSVTRDLITLGVERNALKEEVALCYGTIESRDRNIETCIEENAALKAGVERMRADAERIDWLTENYTAAVFINDEERTPIPLDRASIDTAMKETK